MEDFFKKTGWISMATSGIFALLGLILLYNPNQVLTMVCYAVGGIFIVAGIIKVATYFMAKGKYDIYNLDFAFGIIAIIAGIIVIFASETIIKMFAIVVGVWIIYSGLVRLGLAIKLKKMKNDFWVTITVISIIVITFGLYMVIDSNVIVSTIGLIMFVYGVLDLIQSIVYMKTIKELF